MNVYAGKDRAIGIAYRLRHGFRPHQLLGYGLSVFWSVQHPVDHGSHHVFDAVRSDRLPLRARALWTHGPVLGPQPSRARMRCGDRGWHVPLLVSRLRRKPGHRHGRNGPFRNVYYPRAHVLVRRVRPHDAARDCDLRRHSLAYRCRRIDRNPGVAAARSKRRDHRHTPRFVDPPAAPEHARHGGWAVGARLSRFPRIARPRGSGTGSRAVANAARHRHHLLRRRSPRRCH